MLAGCMAHTLPATGENSLVKVPYPFCTTISKKFLDKPQEVPHTHMNIISIMIACDSS